jgi:predicted nucleotidyltransferase
MVKMYKLRLTNLQEAILRLLFIKSGDELNQRQISKFLDVSQPAVMKALPELEKKEYILLKKDKETKRYSIELNRENNLIMQLKRVDNLKQIYESGLHDFLEREFAGSTVILFGSYSKGEDTLKSDIDISVIGRKKKDIALDNFEKLLGREIRINFYTSLKEVHKTLRENILNGIVLCGGVEL